MNKLKQWGRAYDHQHGWGKSMHLVLFYYSRQPPPAFIHGYLWGRWLYRLGPKEERARRRKFGARQL